jgi:hypothetical protein
MITGDDSDDDRKRWDTIYNTRTYVFGKEPSGFLRARFNNQLFHLM